MDETVVVDKHWKCGGPGANHPVSVVRHTVSMLLVVHTGGGGLLEAAIVLPTNGNPLGL